MYREPSLSGEFAGDYSVTDLQSELGIVIDLTRDDTQEASELLDECADTYNNAASSMFWFELERIAREHVDSAKTETLKSAGFPVIHAYRPDEGQDYITWNTYQDYPGEGTEPYVDLSRVGRGEDQAGQTTTLDRSNFRSLIRDYPDTFTTISYSNVDALGAFITDLSDELVSILAGLVTDYPVYDESDMSELEDGEITESWAQYVSADIRSEIQSDRWDSLTDEGQCNMFWFAVTHLGIYPEHDGHDVLWTQHYAAIAAEIDKRLGQS
jgi:hypothetical protein